MLAKKLLAAFCLLSATSVALPAADTLVRFHTGLGDIDVDLDSTDAPLTVANFLSYVDKGSYNNSFFHRSVPGFIIQGGGYYVASGQIGQIAAQAAVVNEYKAPNIRGSLALAKLGGEPNSGTDEWFFNTVDNSTTLGTANDGGFTVLGHITGSTGLAVMDAIAALPTIDAGGPNDVFGQLPVTGSGTTAANVTVNNLEYVTSINRLPAPTFFSGASALSDGVYYLAFPNKNYFGYFSYLDVANSANYIFHFDLGYEYVFDANDGKGGVYLYDFKSNTFFYTSPTFGFPYLYDFTLNAVLYYYPDPKNAGRYNTNGTRYFYNFATGKIISK